MTTINLVQSRLRSANQGGAFLNHFSYVRIIRHRVISHSEKCIWIQLRQIWPLPNSNLAETLASDDLQNKSFS